MSGKTVTINVNNAQFKEINGCHSVLAFLSSLPISVQHILEIKANKFYDSSNQLYDVNLLIRGYTQHALCPYIDS